MTKVISPVTMQYTEAHIIKGNTLKQVLQNLSNYIEEEDIKSAWDIRIFKTTKRKWQAVLTRGI